MLARLDRIVDRRIDGILRHAARGHVENVEIVLAERADIDIRLDPQQELQPSLVDERGCVHHARWQVRTQFRQVQRNVVVEGDLDHVAFTHERGIEIQVPLEGKPREGRVRADGQFDLRLFLPLQPRLLQRTRPADRLLGAPCQFLHHIVGQPGGHPLPVRRQQVDEQLFSRLHRVDAKIAHQREPQRRAVRVPAGDGDEIRHVDGNAVDIGHHLVTEADPQHAVGGERIIFRKERAVAKRQDQPAVAILLRGAQIRLERFCPGGRNQTGDGRQRCRKQDHKRTKRRREVRDDDP